MRDRLAHLHHRQRLPRRGSDDLPSAAARRSRVPSITSRTDAIGLPRYVGHRPRRAHAAPRHRAHAAAHERAHRASDAARCAAESSEDVPHAELERVGLGVLVARQNPRHAIAAVDLEQHDLIVADGAEAAREGEVDAIRDALADRQPRRRVEPRRRLDARRIDERRRELERIDAEGLLDDLADFGRDRRRRAPASRARSGCRSAPGSGFCSARSSGATPSAPPRRHVAEEQRQHVGGRQRRIRAERRPQLLAGAGKAPPSRDRSAPARARWSRPRRRRTARSAPGW